VQVQLARRHIGDTAGPSNVGVLGDCGVSVRGHPMTREAIGHNGADRLSKLGALEDLTLAQHLMLARLVDGLTAAPGEVIASQGVGGCGFIMIEEGTAEVQRDGERVNILGAGDSFGELPVLAGAGTRTTSVVATSNLRAFALQSHCMRKVRECFPSVARQIDCTPAQRASKLASATSS
jgi:CRP-like cAMP-binding protein